MDGDDFEVLPSGDPKKDFQVRVGRAKSKGEATQMYIGMTPELWAEFAPTSEKNTNKFTIAYSRKQETLRIVADPEGVVELTRRNGGKGGGTAQPFMLKVAIPAGIVFKDADRYGAKHEIDDGKLFVTMPTSVVVSERSPPVTAAPAPSTTRVLPEGSGGRLFRQQEHAQPMKDARTESYGRLPGDPPPGRSALDQRNSKR